MAPAATRASPPGERAICSTEPKLRRANTSPGFLAMNGVEMGAGIVAVGTIAVTVGLACCGGLVGVGGSVCVGDGVGWLFVQPWLKNYVTLTASRHKLRVKSNGVAFKGGLLK